MSIDNRKDKNFVSTLKSFFVLTSVCAMTGDVFRCIVMRMRLRCSIKPIVSPRFRLDTEAFECEKEMFINTNELATRHSIE